MPDNFTAKSNSQRLYLLPLKLVGVTGVDPSLKE